MRLLAFILFFASAAAMAADCRLTGSVCVDRSATKTISGVTVTLAEVGGCWEYEDTYTCIKPNAVNYCQPFVNAQPACWQTSSQCSQMDTLLNSGCMKHLQTWRCGNPATPTPANTIRLDDTYTLVSSNYDPAPCATLEANCEIAESVCSSTTPPALPPGISPSSVAPDGCYEKKNTYACLTGKADTSECDGYTSNPNCSQQTSSCIETVRGQCVFEQKTYQCMSRPPQTNTVTDCSGQLFCQNGNCFDKGYQNDPDFARSIALLEAARQAGVYGSETSIFSGADSRCKIKLFGLANCCKKSSGGGGYSNNQLFNTAVQAGGQVLSYGSRYVYDALYTSSAPNWMVKGMGAMIGVDPVKTSSALAQLSPSLSLYGFTVSTGTIVGAGIVDLGSFAGMNFAFNPTSFAIQIGLMILQDLMSCEQSEQILAMRRGQNLCREIGTYCSSELKLLFIKICLEHTKSYCCYNSRLARIINEQGRGQIGKSWGDAKSPNCSGFTEAEFAAIDFSRIDMSEFTAEIMANIKTPNVGSMSQQVNTSVQQKLQNYYQR